MSRFRRDDGMYESIGWAGDDELVENEGNDWVEEPGSRWELVATGVAAAIVIGVCFVLLVALSYPFIEGIIDWMWSRLSELLDLGR